MVNKMLELAYMSMEGINNEVRDILYSCVAPERRQELMKRGNRISADLSLVAEGLARVMICRAVRKIEAARPASGDCIPDDFLYSGGVAGTLRAQDIRIVQAENGKPYQETVPGLYFNCSHSGIMVACAVAGEEIGVDIQEVVHNIKIRERVYCQEEMQIDAAYDNDEFFSEVWSKKESYLKLTGEGLRREMKTLNVRKLQEDGKAQWYGGRLEEEYYLYVCAEGNRERTLKVQKIRLDEVIEFLKEQRICEG